VNLKTPREFNELALLLTDKIEELVEDYRWAYNAAFSGVKGDSIRRSSGPSDPTGAAASMTRLRSACNVASKRLKQSSDKLDDALGIIEHAMGGIDPRPRSEPIGPRTATVADLDESREAKQRRELRGEGWGNG
jgi:hypothetical protein